MADGDLAREIQKELEALEKERSSGAEASEQPPGKSAAELNPDIHKEAFSDVRRRYEDLLGGINRDYPTARGYLDGAAVPEKFAALNVHASKPPVSISGGGVKGILRKILRKLVLLGISPEIDHLFRTQSIMVQALNAFQDEIRRFLELQQSFNAQVARFGQANVPVIDEKVRYSHDILQKVIAENISLVNQRMDLLFEGLDRKQTEVITWLKNTSREVRTESANMRRSFEELESRFETLKSDLERLVAMQHRKIERFQKALNTAPPSVPGATPPSGTQAESTLDGYAYYTFEMQERGSEASIRESQREYASLFKNHSPVVDIGCGRGEFLEILKENGIDAQGVDSNPDMVFSCEEKGLEVVHGDAMSFLEARAPDSIGGIFSAQVIEHVPRERLLEWLRLMYRALKPGGVVCLETVNIASPFAFFNYYYRDPTHQPPIHPETYRFLLETTGFVSIRLQYRSPSSPGLDHLAERIAGVPEPHGKALKPMFDALKRMHDFLYAPSDIALVAEKPPGESSERSESVSR